MTTDNIQGGFGLSFKLNGTALVGITNVDEVRFARTFRDITGHDSEDGYREMEPDGRKRLEPFIASVVWDIGEATHQAVVSAFDNHAAASLEWADPGGFETITMTAQVEALTRIARQDGVYSADILIHPVKKPTIELTYYQKILNFDPAHLIAYWPMWETSGLAAEQIANTAVQDGVYAGVSLANALGPDGKFYAPRFNDDGGGAGAGWNYIYSTELNTAYDPDHMSLFIWLKPYSVAYWENGDLAWPLYLAHTSAYYHRILKAGTGSYVQPYRYQGTHLYATVDVTGETKWSCWGFTVDLASQSFRIYKDGVVKYNVSSGVQAIGGTDLNSTYTCIGTRRPNANEIPWNGWIAHCAIWSGVQLTTPQMLELATI